MRDRICWLIADLLPKRVIYFCLIRAWAYATTGKYGNTNATGITADDVTERWRKQYDHKPDVIHRG